MAWVSRGIPQLTLFCDPSSTAGKSVLRLVRSARPANITFTPGVPLGVPAIVDEAPASGKPPAPVPRTPALDEGLTAEEQAAQTEELEESRLASAQKSARPIPTMEGEAPSSFLSHLSARDSGAFNLDVQDRLRAPITSTQLSAILSYLPQDTSGALAPASVPAAPAATAAAPVDEPKPDGAPAAEANTYGAGSHAAVQRAKTKARIEAALRAFEERNQAAERRKNESILGSDTPVESLVPPAPGKSKLQVLDQVADDVAASLDDPLPTATTHGPSSSSVVRAGGPVLVWWDEGKAATSPAQMRAILDQVVRQQEETKQPSCSVM